MRPFRKSYSLRALALIAWIFELSPSVTALAYRMAQVGDDVSQSAA
jgi:hypothetical protein